jgi:hypothetical protein
MFNSHLKYYTKWLLNRKNDSWKFDYLEKNFAKSNQLLTNRCLEMAFQFDNLRSKAPLNSGFIINPIYSKAIELRDKALSKYANVFDKEPLQVLLHLPPKSFSPGGYSWLHNLGLAFGHMGINTFQFWDTSAELKLDKNKETLLFTSHSPVYVEALIKSNILHTIRKQSIKIGFTASFDSSKNEMFDDVLFQANKYNFDSFFYTFYQQDYIESTALYSFLQSNNKRVYNLEFAANPLYHYPSQYINKVADYVFLGSVNYDKLNRYNDYFQPLFNLKYKGIVAGPGWKWSKNYHFNLENDKFIYAQAKIALNLHIDIQMNSPSELNERAYQLAAYGIPQLTDNPMVLKSKFNQIGLVATDSEEYSYLFKRFYQEDDFLLKLSNKAMLEVYERHLTFHRIENFLNKFKN